MKKRGQPSLAAVFKKSLAAVKPHANQSLTAVENSRFYCHKRLALFTATSEVRALAKLVSIALKFEGFFPMENRIYILDVFTNLYL